MPGAAGAYAISTGTIYVNQDWLKTASYDWVMAVLTEELGHHLDGLLNTVDTPGDEGEFFARKIQNSVFFNPRILTDSINDAQTILLDGAQHPIESSAITPQVKWTKFYSGNGPTFISSEMQHGIYIAGNKGGSAEITFLDKSGVVQWKSLLSAAVYAIDTGSNGLCVATGFTEGALYNPYKGGGDLWISAYNKDGTRAWTRTIGTTKEEIGRDIAINEFGRIYVAGSTTGSVPGGVNTGGADAIIASYDTNGTQLWIKQLANTVSAQAIWGRDDNYAFAAGQSWDGGDFFVSKVSPDGVVEWQLNYGGTGRDVVAGITGDASGDIYICGSTGSSLGQQFKGGTYDSFVAKLSGVDG